MPLERQTQAFFHHYAGRFNAIYSTRNTPIGTLVNKVFRRSMDLRFRKTLEDCQPVEGARVLDLGCGPGHYGIALASQGAASVVGIDFAQGMIELARDHALVAGVAERCDFRVCDFGTYTPEEPFDYVVVMGVMDYVADPRPLIERVASFTRRRAFFSFPAAGGVLAWQRQLRYRSRCPLYLYTREQVETLVRGLDGTWTRIERIARDFFVTVSRKDEAGGSHA
jgi:SAM-dependent methyltransferase